MKIIGFAGKAGSGKDTAGYILQHALEARGYKVAVLSFADKLKDAAALLLGWDRELLQNDVEYKEGRTLPDGSIDPACDLLNLPSRRDFLQRFGTEAMRNNIDENFWIRVLQLAIINGEYSDYDFGIVTDMRFINEIEFVRNNGGMAVRIDRVGEMSTLTSHFLII